jgi:hypothetical protein
VSVSACVFFVALSINKVLCGVYSFEWMAEKEKKKTMRAGIASDLWAFLCSVKVEQWRHAAELGKCSLWYQDPGLSHEIKDGE